MKFEMDINRAFYLEFSNLLTLKVIVKTLVILLDSSLKINASKMETTKKTRRGHTINRIARD